MEMSQVVVSVSIRVDIPGLTLTASAETPAQAERLLRTLDCVLDGVGSLPAADRAAGVTSPIPSSTTGGRHCAGQGHTRVSSAARRSSVIADRR